MNTLLVVAHPDDEVLWFTSVLLRHRPFVVCVTGGRDVEDQTRRRQAFNEVMNLFGITQYAWIEHPDTHERLDVERLTAELQRFAERPLHHVYTHSIEGETHAHIHHQDVSYVVHQVFETVHSIAYNQLPTVVNVLTPEEYALKKYALGTLYHEEYNLLRDTYEISAVESFASFSREASEIYYRSIARFGEAHEVLALNYPDFWGFQYSPYEMERHAMILSLVERAAPRRILEFGACEGVLTERLACIAPTDCVEEAPTYRAVLAERGFTVVDSPRTDDYDLSVVAAFLEYLQDPTGFLNGLRCERLVIDVISDSMLDKRLEDMLAGWRRVAEDWVRPRWERMYWGRRKERFEVYRLGAHGVLYELTSV